MNAEQLKKAQNIAKEITTVIDKVKALRVEEQTTFNTLSEDEEESENGSTLSKNIENLEAAESSLDEAFDFLANLE